MPTQKLCELSRAQILELAARSGADPRTVVSFLLGKRRTSHVAATAIRRACFDLKISAPEARP